MAITISGSGITSANIADGTIVNADVNDVAASKLTGALPAISGASLSNLPGGGKLLQVVSTHNTASTVITANTNFMSVSITPSSTSSKILIFVTLTSVAERSNYSYAEGYWTIRKGASTLTVMDGIAPWNGNAHGSRSIGSMSCNYLDSPSTTSSITYHANGQCSSAGMSINNEGGTSSIILMEVGV